MDFHGILILKTLVITQFHQNLFYFDIADVTVEEFNLDLIRLDTDVVTMEMPLYFKQFFLVSKFILLVSPS